jgi:hypothetical protein
MKYANLSDEIWSYPEDGQPCLQRPQHHKIPLYAHNFRNGLASDRSYFLFGLGLRGHWKIRPSGIPDRQQPARYAKISDLTTVTRARQRIGGSISITAFDCVQAVAALNETRASRGAILEKSIVIGTNCVAESSD